MLRTASSDSQLFWISSSVIVSILPVTVRGPSVPDFIPSHRLPIGWLIIIFVGVTKDGCPGLSWVGCCSEIAVLDSGCPNDILLSRSGSEWCSVVPSDWSWSVCEFSNLSLSLSLQLFRDWWDTVLCVDRRDDAAVLLSTSCGKTFRLSWLRTSL